MVIKILVGVQKTWAYTEIIIYPYFFGNKFECLKLSFAVRKQVFNQAVLTHKGAKSGQISLPHKADFYQGLSQKSLTANQNSFTNDKISVIVWGNISLHRRDKNELKTFHPKTMHFLSTTHSEPWMEITGKTGTLSVEDKYIQ